MDRKKGLAIIFLFLVIVCIITAVVAMRSHQNYISYPTTPIVTSNENSVPTVTTASELPTFSCDVGLPSSHSANLEITDVHGKIRFGNAFYITGKMTNKAGKEVPAIVSGISCDQTTGHCDTSKDMAILKPYEVRDFTIVTYDGCLGYLSDTSCKCEVWSDSIK